MKTQNNYIIYRVMGRGFQGAYTASQFRQLLFHWNLEQEKFQKKRKKEPVTFEHCQ